MSRAPGSTRRWRTSSDDAPVTSIDMCTDTKKINVLLVKPRAKDVIYVENKFMMLEAGIMVVAMIKPVKRRTSQAKPLATEKNIRRIRISDSAARQDLDYLHIKLRY